MKRIALAAVLLVALFGSVRAGYEEGAAAYQRGDYATALKEWRPLAEQGNAASCLILVVNFEFQIVFVGEKGDCAGSQSEELTPLQIFSSVFGSVLFPDIAIDLLKG